MLLMYFFFLLTSAIEPAAGGIQQEKKIVSPSLSHLLKYIFVLLFFLYSYSTNSRREDSPRGVPVRKCNKKRCFWRNKSSHPSIYSCSLSINKNNLRTHTEGKHIRKSCDSILPESHYSIFYTRYYISNF